MTNRLDSNGPGAPPEDGVPPSWFETAFGDLYPVVYAHRTAEAAAPEAAFACAQTGLGPGDCALDLCCGAGRHMVHLLRQSPHVTGADYSAQLLRRARQALGGAAGLVRADMRRLPFPARFDVVFNFFTSFGYFAEEEDDRRAAREMARVLKPGGRLFMDYMNAARDTAALVPHSERTVGARRIVERRWYDSGRRRINKTVEVCLEGRPEARITESVRAYRHEELAALLEGAGFRLLRVFGAADGRGFDDTAPRLMLLAEKRADA